MVFLKRFGNGILLVWSRNDLKRKRMILGVSEKDNRRNDSLAKRPVTDAVGGGVARENRWGQVGLLSRRFL